MDYRFSDIIALAQKASFIVVLGPTASGKTAFAVKLAQALEAEIISADSRQVYKNMDIGTGKDLEEYHKYNVPYHLIDHVSPGEKYHLHQFQLDFEQTYQNLINNHKTVILCGGSGLYLDAALNPKLQTQIPENLDLRSKLKEETYSSLLEMWERMPKDARQSQPDTSTAKRLIRAIEINMFLQAHPSFEFENRKPLEALVFGLSPDIEQRRINIEKRLNIRLKQGLIDEVKQLLASGIAADTLIYYGLEYKFITLYLLGQLSYEQMCQKLLIAIQQFAKRQMTYFRKLEKEGLKIHWINPNTL